MTKNSNFALNVLILSLLLLLKTGTNTANTHKVRPGESKQSRFSHDPDRSHFVSSLSCHGPGAVLGGSRRQRPPRHLPGSCPHHLPVSGFFGSPAASLRLPAAEHERRAAGGVQPQPDSTAGRQHKGHLRGSRGRRSRSVPHF